MTSNARFSEGLSDWPFILRLAESKPLERRVEVSAGCLDRSRAGGRLAGSQSANDCVELLVKVQLG